LGLTAGTIFHSTKLPLTSWFLAMWLIASAKNGISSVELGRRLGIKQTNAWAMKQKIMAVMAGREDTKVDSGTKRNGLSKADLDVSAELAEQRLERGEEAEAFPGRQVVGEDDLLPPIAHSMADDTHR
jgi:hypothetical protein